MTGAGEHNGWKAVWLSTIDSYEELDAYTEDVWNENGECELSPFARDFRIGWYDADLREFDIRRDAKTFAELFAGVSDEELFIDELLSRLDEFDPGEYRSFMIIDSYRYPGHGSSERAVFVGNFRYGAD